jgi:hypothetical protein
MSAVCLLLAMFTGDDWMVDLMIICIEKTVAKALDVNNIINFEIHAQVQISQ